LQMPLNRRISSPSLSSLLIIKTFLRSTLPSPTKPVRSLPNVIDRAIESISQTMPLSLLSLGLGPWSIIFFGVFIFPVFVGYNLARYRNMASTSNALLFSGIWLACSASTITAHSVTIVRFMQSIGVPEEHFPP
jgi:hypothetical protein